MADSALNDTVESAESSVELDQQRHSIEPRRRKKRLRACVPCRNNKTRCRPVENLLECEACIRASRECVIPGPGKPRAVTSNRVSALEKKIELLTNALLSRSSAEVASHSSAANTGNLQGVSIPCELSNQFRSYHRQHENGDSGNQNPPFSLSKGLDLSYQPKSAQYQDVIEKSFLDIETASSLLEYWSAEICSKSPVVFLDAGLTIQHLRISRPMLLLCILAAASSSIQPSLATVLVRELNQQLTQRVLILGHKSMDLIQALLVYTQHYIRPENSQQGAFNQYIHIALAMHFDLSLNRKGRMTVTRDLTLRAEMNRTALACYYVATSTANLLRQPFSIPFDEYLEDCMNSLTGSADASVNDQWLCCLVRLEQIAAEASMMMKPDESTSNTLSEDTRTQCQLQMFQRQITKWENTIPSSISADVRRLLTSHIDLLVHEIAIYNYSRIAARHKRPFETMNASHVQSLCRCLTSCHNVLDTFLALESLVIRAMPRAFTLRVVYSTVMLIKMGHFANSMLQNGLVAPDVKAEIYIESVIAKFADISTKSHWMPAAEFGLMFQKLRLWGQHRKTMCKSWEVTADVDNPDLEASEEANEDMFHEDVSNNLGSFDAACEVSAYAAADWQSFTFDAHEMHEFDMHMMETGWMSNLL